MWGLWWPGWGCQDEAAVRRALLLASGGTGRIKKVAASGRVSGNWAFLGAQLARQGKEREGLDAPTPVPFPGWVGGRQAVGS